MASLISIVSNIQKPYRQIELAGKEYLEAALNDMGVSGFAVIAKGNRIEGIEALE